MTIYFFAYHTVYTCKIQFFLLLHAKNKYKCSELCLYNYFFLIISSTQRFLFAGSSLAVTLSFNKPTITSKILFTFLHKSVESLSASSVREMRYSVLFV